MWKRDPSACSEAVGCLGVFARHTLDAEEADPDERRERELVVVIRSCWIFALCRETPILAGGLASLAWFLFGFGFFLLFGFGYFCLQTKLSLC